MSTSQSEITKNQISQLFAVCDLDGSGSLDKEELANICPDLSKDEIDFVFNQLDTDGDGTVSIAEFSAGFKGITDSLLALSRRKKLESSASEEARTKEENEREMEDFVGRLEDGLTSLSCQEQVCELYQQLHAAELPQILANFEGVLLNVIRDIRQYQYENERLERLYKRDKESHESHLRQLEEEMETVVQKVELRVRKEEREKADMDRMEMKAQMETEITELQNNLKKLQQLETKYKKVYSEEEGQTMKQKLNDLLAENRTLRSSLTEAQTNLTLLRSELVTVRQQLEEKCDEQESEKETLMEYIREQDSLTRQVHMLQDANKRLQDTNDDLRAALENIRGAHKRTHSGTPRTGGSLNLSISRQSSVLSGINSPTTGASPLNTSRTSQNRPGSNLADELQQSLQAAAFVSSPDVYSRRLLPNQESCEVDSIPENEDFDSGHSTMRDLADFNDMDSDYEPNSIEEELQYTPRKKKYHGGTDTENEPHDDEMDGDLDFNSRPHSRSSVRSAFSHWSSASQKSTRSSRRQLPTIPSTTVDIDAPITGEPERMYKVVLAGDAAVGKSSFIMRLCKGHFVSNLTSTLGIDFHTKTIRVDGRIIALQLWDTAGQERFRSIAKSYFRRADGVLLLYDSTYERSFINVRDWVEAIEDGSQKKIPIMLIGNKTDLKEEAEADGKRVVSTEEGQKLAKDFDGLFIETSAKDGNHIKESVIELARLLRTNEDLEVKSVGMKLHDMKIKEEKKAFGCCGSS